MPLQETSGAASYDAFGGGVAAVPNYIEDVFSTYLYTGNGSTQTITNGIDLAGKGGLTWLKRRDAVRNHGLFDTVRGATKLLYSDLTNAEYTDAYSLTSFNSNGFSLGLDGGGNANGGTYASWTFRKQPKFFDIVTYTGNGVSSRTIAHSLGSAPGCVIIKNLTSIGNWCVWHRGNGTTDYTALSLNTTNSSGNVGPGNYPDFTSTTFKPNSVQAASTGAIGNLDGDNYVAYLFAHNAGGFGLTGTDNVISCGSFSLDSAVGVDVNLGYEAQWVMIKRTDSSAGSSGWYLLDTMRGWTVDTTFGDMYLVANTTAAEAGQNIGRPTATGFAIQASTWLSTGSYIYVAIRRGPMKVPTYAPSVFYSSSFGDTQTSFPTGFVTDFAINKVTYYNPDLGTYTDGSNFMLARLTANTTQVTNQASTQSNLDPASFWAIQDGYKWANGSGYSIFGWAFARAPYFADVVCYTGNDTLRTINHNLGVAPEMMIIKNRDTALDWAVYHTGLGNTKYIFLNSTAASATASSYWNDTSPTASVFTVNTSNKVNSSPSPYLAYLFATCAGISKVGSYTGTGSTQTIDCGFTGGARFVLIKRTNTTGDWFVYDSSRGIQSGNDPYLRFNSSLPAVTNTNYVDAAASGFQVIGSGLNVSGGTYIFLAIA